MAFCLLYSSLNYVGVYDVWRKNNISETSEQMGT